MTNYNLGNKKRPPGFRKAFFTLFCVLWSKKEISKVPDRPRWPATRFYASLQKTGSRPCLQNYSSFCPLNISSPMTEAMTIIQQSQYTKKASKNQQKKVLYKAKVLLGNDLWVFQSLFFLGNLHWQKRQILSV